MAGKPTALVDTGPLVALFNRRDDFHQPCVETLKTFRGPLLTVWPVVTEAMHLLAFSDRAQDALWEFLLAQTLLVVPLDTADMPRMRELMHRYRDRRMDLADAALVRVAEREHIRTIFTIDQRDFRLYRPKHLGHFHLVPTAD